MLNNDNDRGNILPQMHFVVSAAFFCHPIYSLSTDALIFLLLRELQCVALPVCVHHQNIDRHMSVAEEGFGALAARIGACVTWPSERNGKGEACSIGTRIDVRDADVSKEDGIVLAREPLARECDGKTHLAVEGCHHGNCNSP